MKKRLSTLDDVAQKAGVSHQTVSRVLNKPGLVSPATRQRVLEAMEALQFVPNRSAQLLAGKATRTLGFITVSLALHAPSQIAAAIKSHAARAGYSVVIATLETGTLEELQRSLNEMRAQKVDGVIINLPLTADAAARLVDDNNDLLCQFLDVPADSDVFHVSFDPRDGSRQSVEYLLHAGHEHFALLAGPEHSVASTMRLACWQDVLNEHGRHACAVLHGNWSSKDAWQQTLSLFRTRRDITALLVANDQMAFGAMSALDELGLRVPQDVSVVGYDDTPDSAYFIPALTTVEQDFNRLGAESVSRMVARLTHSGAGESTLLPTRFIERRSTAPRRATHRDRERLLDEMARLVKALRED
ncbi:Transcriptional repressor of the lac operon [Cronobacter condimenti 1330]|uniref:LacI family transcriptional regulator n=1 Tax=Cronobacter condimenti 1330 TaxID=1073999 RepID=K8A3A9_9ENTR|nr:LacI family DNA-binding transcriptional regulator [Cronobacter condimenti]ALB61803.1 LacI family transcriptional regulator [Cronobacter condimenti 1330]CCJ74423.1 Transcriptional repressor of the lac operon [Cronobacter condimenti 1330]